MIKRVGLSAIALALLFAGVAVAQYPVLDMIADKVVQKYQQSTCEQLWEQRGKPKSADEQRIVEMRPLRHHDDERRVRLAEVPPERIDRRHEHEPREERHDREQQRAERDSSHRERGHSVREYAPDRLRPTLPVA